MEVGTVELTLVITALIVLTGQQNGFVSATTPNQASTTMPMTTTSMQSASEMSSSSSTQATQSAMMMQSTTTTSVSDTNKPTQTIQPATVTTRSITTAAPPTKNPAEMTTAVQKEKISLAKKFHTVMIVMIVVLGFILIFSISCGLCVIFGIDVGCPIPCCGGGDKAANYPAGSSSGMKLKRSSRPDRISSHRLHDAEEVQEVECKGIKGHGSEHGQDNTTYYEF